MEDRRFEFGMEIAGRNDFERNLTGGATIAEKVKDVELSLN